MRSQLFIRFTSGSCAGTLHVADELVRAGDEHLERWIDDAITAGCSRLEVNCSRVTQVATPSLVVLSAARARLEAGGGSLLVTHASPVFALSARQGGFGDLLGSAAACGSNVGIRKLQPQ